MIQKENRLKEDKYTLNGKIRDLEREIDFQRSTMEKELLLLQLELKESKSNVAFFRQIVAVLCFVIAVMFMSKWVKID